MSPNFVEFDPSKLKEGEHVWSFGYGSNMDVESLQNKKLVKVLDHTPAVLKDYSLRFDLWGLCWVEPSFANLKHEEGEEVHGVAFKMTQEGMRKLDSQEGYKKRFVTLNAYDGRQLKGFIYINEIDKPDKPASKRYMGILVKGAIAAGLKPEYVDKLRAIPTYSPPEFLLKMRERRGKLSDYKEISLEELSKHKSVEDNWVCILGYVIKTRNHVFFGSHRGRDSTARQLMHYKQISTELYDDGGKPPFPLVKNLTPDELEYLNQWLDYYLAGKSDDGVSNLGEIIGHLKEFREQQESGVSDFKLPVIAE